MSKIVKVNLSNSSYSVRPINPTVTKTYLGGRGLGAYLYSINPKKAQDPENSVFIVPGLLTGTLFPSSSRGFVITSSPLTDYYTCSSFGGVFAAYLKHSDISALEITGQAKTWCYVLLEGGKVTFHNARKLKGKTVFETQEILKKRYKDKKISIAAIGQGGEHLVKFSSLMFDKRAAGRTGTGWHFGHKKLKAIVIVEGDTEIGAKDPKLTQEILRGLVSKKIENDKEKADYATSVFTEWSNSIQTYPASNYQRNFVSIKEIEKLKVDVLNKLGPKKEACWSCPLGCTRILKDRMEGNIRGPEYETIWALGANCDNFDIDSVVKCNHLCDSFSLDTISTGGVLAWYKECVDKRLIKDTWSAERMYKLIEEIAFRKGVGRHLADGVVAAARHFKVGKELVVHSKGLELPAWDPRTAVGMAINYATAPTGGDHCKGWTVGEDTLDSKTRFSIKNKAANVIKHQDQSALIDSLGTCIFADFLYDLGIWSRIIKAYFGYNLPAKKLKEIGGKVFNIEHKINKSLGHKLSENILPEKIIGYRVEVDGEQVSLTQKMFSGMMKEYVQFRGWK